MVWPQGGLSGLAWDGKDKCINLMPRSLRWHSLWHTYRYYLYGISLIYFMVGLVSIYMCWTSYGIYDQQKVEYLNLRANAQYQVIEQKYSELIAIKHKILKNTSDSTQETSRNQIKWFRRFHCLLDQMRHSNSHKGNRTGKRSYTSGEQTGE